MQTTPRRRVAVSELVMGVLLLAAAGVILFDAARLPPPPAYGMGPEAVPRLIAAGMILLGILTIAAAWRRREAEAAEEAEEGPLDPAAVVVILASLAGLIALMTLGGGFILACTVLFAGTARAFGRRAPVADIAIGLVLSFLIYAMFTQLLTLSLPDGPLERFLRLGLDPAVQAIKSRL